MSLLVSPLESKGEDPAIARNDGPSLRLREDSHGL
jgi:hypothetical protein